MIRFGTFATLVLLFASVCAAELDAQTTPPPIPPPPASKVASSAQKAAAPASNVPPSQAAAPASKPAAKSPEPAPKSKMSRTDGPTISLPSKKPRSEFLSLPGSGPVDRYGPDPVDWAALPPWRKTEFFGIRVEGRFFIYVLDCSGSMAFENRMARAKSALRASVGRLQAPQRFRVIFYNDLPIPMPGEVAQPADVDAKDQLARWLRLIEPEGQTDPRPALQQAIGLRPDAIFLLSDGEFPEGTVESIARKNVRKIPIHCVDLSAGEAGDQLKRIAAQSGGSYAARPYLNRLPQ